MHNNQIVEATAMGENFNRQSDSFKWICESCTSTNLKHHSICEVCNVDKNNLNVTNQPDTFSDGNLNATDENLMDVKEINERYKESLSNAHTITPSGPIEEECKIISHSVIRENETEINKMKEEISKFITDNHQLISSINTIIDSILSNDNEFELSLAENERLRNIWLEHKQMWKKEKNNLKELFDARSKVKWLQLGHEQKEQLQRKIEIQWEIKKSSFNMEKIKEDDLKGQFSKEEAKKWRLKMEGMRIMWELKKESEWKAEMLTHKFESYRKSQAKWIAEHDSIINAKLKDKLVTVKKLIGDSISINQQFQDSQQTNSYIKTKKENYENSKLPSASTIMDKKLFTLLEGHTNEIKELKMNIKSVHQELSGKEGRVIKFKNLSDTNQNQLEKFKSKNEELEYELEKTKLELNSLKENIKIKSGKNEQSNLNYKINLSTVHEEKSHASPTFYNTTFADEENASHSSKTQTNQKKDKKGIEEPPINRWFCEFCTIANSIEHHICLMCGKTNDKIRELNASKYGALSKINKSNWKLENRNIEENNSIDSIMDYDDDDPYFQKFQKATPNQEKTDNSDDGDHSYKSAENVPFDERTVKDIDVSRDNRESWPIVNYLKQFAAWLSSKGVEERNLKDRLNHTSWDELDEKIKKCYRRLLTEEVVKTDIEAQHVAILIHWFPHLDEDLIIRKYNKSNKDLELVFKYLIKIKK